MWQGLSWAVTVEKAVFVVLSALVLAGWYLRRTRKAHVGLMLTASIGLLLLFSVVVVERFAFPHGPAPSARGSGYWIIFAGHVLTGLVALLGAMVQVLTGGIMLAGGQSAVTVRPWHRRCGYATMALLFLSLGFSIPM